MDTVAVSFTVVLEEMLSTLAQHPETARRIARKLWRFFITDIRDPDPSFVESAATVYLQNATEIRPVVRFVLTSSWFTDPSMRFTRYAGPAEFVVRAIKEVGWQGLSLDEVLAPMASMGMQLFEPPHVGGWPSGTGWLSTATMLARSNFAATLAGSQKESLAASVKADGRTPQALLAAMLDRVTPAPFDAVPQRALDSYLLAGGAWTGSADQLNTRTAGLARLLVASSEYQFV